MTVWAAAVLIASGIVAFYLAVALLLLGAYELAARLFRPRESAPLLSVMEDWHG